MVDENTLAGERALGRGLTLGSAFGAALALPLTKGLIRPLKALEVFNNVKICLRVFNGTREVKQGDLATAWD